MADDKKLGFEIDGVLYPMPDAFRMGDPVLVAELTGMEFNDFAEALDDEDRRTDPVILIGLVGVAVWQKHKTWRRDKVRRYVERIDLDSFEAVGGDDGPDEGDDGPPVEGSSESSAKSKDSLEE